MGMGLTDSATVTMAITDFRAAEAEIDKLRAENVELQKARAVPADPSLDPVADLRTVLAATLPIVQFAVGHLDPATVKDWPHGKLVAVADLINRIYPDDSNLTTLISALALYSYGTGPIKGFAVTLSVGILANLFTAVFVSRLLFDIYLGNRGRVERLSI